MSGQLKQGIHKCQNLNSTNLSTEGRSKKAWYTVLDIWLKKMLMLVWQATSPVAPASADIWPTRTKSQRLLAT